MRLLIGYFITLNEDKTFMMQCISKQAKHNATEGICFDILEV